MYTIRKGILITLICVGIVLLAFGYYAFILNRTPIFCNNKEGLTKLTRMEFTDVEITEIKYEYSETKDVGTYTQIFIFLKETEELESKEYFFNDRGAGIYDPELEHIPTKHLQELEEIGLKIDNIQKHGGNFCQIKQGPSIVSYEIHWYQIDDSYDGKSNVVLLTSVPRKVSFDVDKILNE